jgi:mRNA interferase HigB
MKLLAKHILKHLTDRYAESRSQVEAWVSDVEETNWQTPHDLKSRYPKASILGGQNVIFNINGNKYRIWVKVEYKNGVVLIKNAGTHKEYDKWNIV